MGKVAEFTDIYGVHFVVYESSEHIRFVIKTTMGQTCEIPKNPKSSVDVHRPLFFKVTNEIR